MASYMMQVPYGNTMVSRIAPLMSAGHYKTFEWKRPLKTHWKIVDCAYVNCASYEQGWVTTVDENTTLGKQQAFYIRHDKSRKHSETKTPEGLTCFTFPAGQECFNSLRHRAPVAREPLYVVRDGDWRGNPRHTTPRVHKYADDWVDDFSEHMSTLEDAIKRG